MHDSFTELSLIIAIAAGVSLVMRLIRQPQIIGYIITGIVVGPSVLHLVQSAETIEVFAKIGIALLLFIIGLGLNPRVIKEVGRAAFFAGVAQMVATGFIGWGAGQILGYGKTESIILGLALAFSSTIIILKLLSDKREQSRLYGKITIGILIVQDVVATVALLIVTAQSGEQGFSAADLTILTAKALAIGIPLILIGTKVLPKMHNLIAGSQEFLFLFSIGWGFGIAALFEFVGFSLEVGALFAGVALATLPYAQEISSRLRPLRDFFVVVFFISLGATLNLTNLDFVLPAVLLCLIIVIFIKPIVTMIAMGLLGYTKQTSFKTSISLAQISEFSLVLVALALSKGEVTEQFAGVITLVAIISIALSSYLIIYSNGLYEFVDKHFLLFESHKVPYEQKEARRHYDIVLFGYQRGGHEFVKVFQALKKRFVVIDYDPDVIERLERAGTDFLYGDATDIEMLSEAGLEHAKLVVSTITDHEANQFLVRRLERTNPNAVVICHADSVAEASMLYELGAAYVMMPHYIGSEKIGAFIKKNGFKKTEFKKFREHHLQYLQNHYEPDDELPSE